MSDSSFPTLISKDDNANAIGNPIYVQTVNTPEVVTNVANYKPDTLAGSGTANHDYPVVGSFFRLKSVLIASTGNSKYEVKVGPVATLVTKAVAFISTNEQSFRMVFDPPISVPVTGTGTVRVVKTNRQNQSSDLYTTIEGEDVA